MSGKLSSCLVKIHIAQYDSCVSTIENIACAGSKGSHLPLIMSASIDPSSTHACCKWEDLDSAEQVFDWLDNFNLLLAFCLLAVADSILALHKLKMAAVA